jgi:hypothetical protein
MFILYSTIIIHRYKTFIIGSRCTFAGDDLDDNPDSPGSAPHLTGEAASQLPDADDSAMESATACASNSREGECSGHHLKRCLNETSLSLEMQSNSVGPNLPPIY